MAVDRKNEKTASLVILAAGASSRMKASAAGSDISDEIARQANSQSKGLIRVGNQGRPLLDYILYNARSAGFHRIVMVVGEDHEGFKTFYGPQQAGNAFHGLSISYAIQHLREGRSNPFGTADAVLQAMEQYEDLQHCPFAVCNSDNLYSVNAFRALRESSSPNALILYDRDGLDFPPEKIARFAVMAVNERSELTDIIEKPPVDVMEQYRDAGGVIRVSMNVFKFSGEMIYSFLQNCPITPGREEKEIPSALRNMIAKYPASVLGIPLKEHVPDLTEKKDIAGMRRYLAAHHTGLNW